MMQQNPQLWGSWAVWVNFQTPEDANTQIDYNDYLKKIHTLNSYNDLAYFWQESPFRNLKNFLVYEKESNMNCLTKYEIQGRSRIISAINYFRQGINPTWEDENNKYGGRLVFNIDKEITKVDQIYQWLIFYFLGESESCADGINGVRFISHRAAAALKWHFRVEVWTKFSLKQESKVVQFRETFVKDFFNQFMSSNANLNKFFKPQFKNNQQAKQQAKEQKDHHRNRHEQENSHKN